MERELPDLRVAFWNVQNLFEPSVVKRGPRSDVELEARLDVLARVIERMFGGGGPHLLGLAEIHTEPIFDRLRGRLKGDYHKLWEGSPSSRQTGLGLLARKDMFTDVKTVGVHRPGMKRPRCLLARCELSPRIEPLLVAVNHWKSRLPTNGLDPELDRVETADWLGEQLATSLRATCAIVLGDFNAEPYERPFNERAGRALRSVRFFSTTLWAGATPAYLYNTAWRHLGEPDYWESVEAAGKAYRLPRPRTSHGNVTPVIFDQLLVSGHALRGGPITLKESTVGYHCDADTSRRKRTGQIVPSRWSRTREGRADTGASDHFPLTATFRVNGGHR